MNATGNLMKEEMFQKTETNAFIMGYEQATTSLDSQLDSFDRQNTGAQ